MSAYDDKAVAMNGNARVIASLIESAMRVLPYRIRQFPQGKRSIVFGTTHPILANFGKNGQTDLPKAQVRANAEGYRSYSIASNIYGWAVLDIMTANICGGNYSVTPRGLTLQEAVAHGLALVRVPNWYRDIEIELESKGYSQELNDLLKKIVFPCFQICIRP